MKKSWLLTVALALAITLSQVSMVHSQNHNADAFLNEDGKYLRWGTPSPQTVTLTYAFAESDLRFRNGISKQNCLHTRPFSGLLDRSKIELAAFHEQVVRALRSWEMVTNIRFIKAERELDADVHFAVQAQPRFVAFVNLALHPDEGKPYRRIRKAIVCFNPLLPWSLAFSDDQKKPMIESVVQHEIGHVIGLDHSDMRVDARMAFRYTGLTVLTKEDITTVQALYGKK